MLCYSFDQNDLDASQRRVLELEMQMATIERHWTQRFHDYVSLRGYGPAPEPLAPLPFSTMRQSAVGSAAASASSSSFAQSSSDDKAAEESSWLQKYVTALSGDRVNMQTRSSISHESPASASASASASAAAATATATGTRVPFGAAAKLQPRQHGSRADAVSISSERSQLDEWEDTWSKVSVKEQLPVASRDAVGYTFADSAAPSTGAAVPPPPSVGSNKGTPTSSLLRRRSTGEPAAAKTSASTSASAQVERFLKDRSTVRLSRSGTGNSSAMETAATEGDASSSPVTDHPLHQALRSQQSRANPIGLGGSAPFDRIVYPEGTRTFLSSQAETGDGGQVLRRKSTFTMPTDSSSAKVTARQGSPPEVKTNYLKFR